LFLCHNRFDTHFRFILKKPRLQESKKKVYIIIINIVLLIIFFKLKLGYYQFKKKKINLLIQIYGMWVMPYRYIGIQKWHRYILEYLTKFFTLPKIRWLYKMEINFETNMFHHNNINILHLSYQWQWVITLL